jgi:broad specificity phosphatase PhoE
MTKPSDTRETVRFVRHGATAANLLGLRCGGDLDLGLVEAGREQAVRAALRIIALEQPVRLIVTSDLRRTRETAEIIARVLGGAAIVVEPDFAERSLGEWNLRSIDGTQEWLERGHTPPGGETNETFEARIARAVCRIVPGLPGSALFVGSKGVARVLGELARAPASLDLDNAALAEFDFTNLILATARRAS